MRLKLLASILLFANLSYGQRSAAAEEVMNRAIKTYADGDFQMKMTYRLETLDGFKVDSYQGVAIKKGGVIYLKINQTEFYQKDSLLLKVNIDEQAGILTKTAGNAAALMNLSAWEQFSEVRLLEGPDHYIISLLTPEITQFPYEKMEIRVDKEAYTIASQTMYLIRKIPVEKNGVTTFENALLQIAFNASPENISELKNLDDILIKGRNGYYLAGQYQQYELFDQSNL